MTTQLPSLEVEVFAYNEQAWINGEIKDIFEHHGQKQYMVQLCHPQFGGIEMNFNLQQVRYRSTLPHQNKDAVFRKGDVVEVFCQTNKDDIAESDDIVHGWRKAAITNLRGNYAYLEFESSYHPDQLPQIYHIHVLRHLQEQKGPNPDLFNKADVHIPFELLTWVQTFDTLGHHIEYQSFIDHLKLIAKNTGVYGINLSPDRSRIVILGPQERLKSAAIAVETQNQIRNIAVQNHQSNGHHVDASVYGQTAVGGVQNQQRKPQGQQYPQSYSNGQQQQTYRKK